MAAPRRCEMLGCRETVKGRKKFCDPHWAALPSHLQSDIAEAVLDEDEDALEDLIGVAIDNLLVQSGDEELDSL